MDGCFQSILTDNIQQVKLQDIKSYYSTQLSLPRSLENEALERKFIAVRRENNTSINHLLVKLFNQLNININTTHSSISNTCSCIIEICLGNLPAKIISGAYIGILYNMIIDERFHKSSTILIECLNSVISVPQYLEYYSEIYPDKDQKIVEKVISDFNKTIVKSISIIKSNSYPNTWSILIHLFDSLILCKQSPLKFKNRIRIITRLIKSLIEHCDGCIPGLQVYLNTFQGYRDNMVIIADSFSNAPNKEVFVNLCDIIHLINCGDVDFKAYFGVLKRVEIPVLVQKQIKMARENGIDVYDIFEFGRR